MAVLAVGRAVSYQHLCWLCHWRCGGDAAGAVTAFARAAETLLAPAIRVVRATPVASFIILALLWLGKARVPTFSAALMVTPVVWQAVFAALRNTDKDLLEMARIFGFSRMKSLKLIYIPSVRISWSAACATSMGLAWKSGVAAEVICQVHPTIGEALYSAKIYLETPDLFAWTAVVIARACCWRTAGAALWKTGGDRYD